jgi:hypothetical protein
METETYAKVTASEGNAMTLCFTSIFFEEGDSLFKEIVGTPDPSHD